MFRPRDHQVAAILDVQRWIVIRQFGDLEHRSNAVAFWYRSQLGEDNVKLHLPVLFAFATPANDAVKTTIGAIHGRHTH